jgi:hypothetical protein
LDYISVADWYWKWQVRDGFPRDLGRSRYYPKGENCGYYYKYILQQIIQGDDAYVSVYSDATRNSKVVDYIFLDFDSMEHFEDMRLFLCAFWNSIDVFFSGSKGLHIYLYIQPTSYTDLAAHKLRLYTVLNTWTQAEIDKITFLNLSGMVRIPFTRHNNKPFYKVPISHDISQNELFEIARNPHLHTDYFERLIKRERIPLNWQFLLKSPAQAVKEAIRQP